MEEVIGYEKVYKIRRVQSRKNTLQVTFPYSVVQKEAREKGITVPEYLKTFAVKAIFGNGVDGVLYKFVDGAATKVE